MEVAMTRVVRSPTFGWITAAGTAVTSALLIAAILVLSVPLHQGDGIARGPFGSPLQDAVQPSWLAATVIDKAHDLGLGMPASATYSKSYWSRAADDAPRLSAPRLDHGTLEHGTDLVYVVYLYYPPHDPNPTTGSLSPSMLPAPALPDPAIQTVVTIGIDVDSREVFSSFVEAGQVTFETMSNNLEKQALKLP